MKEISKTLITISNYPLQRITGFSQNTVKELSAMELKKVSMG